MRAVAILAACLMLSAPAFAAGDGASWRGFYVGATGGERYLTAHWRTDSALNGNFALSPETRAPALNSETGRFGVDAGWNAGFDSPWLLGVEADWAEGWNAKSYPLVPGTDWPIPPGNPDSTSVSASWDSSIRVRGGYEVSPRWLVYGTAGLAALRVKATVNCPVDGVWCGDASHFDSYERTQLGWTAGAGVERLIADHWIARLEYRYSDYGTFSHTFLPAAASDDVETSVYMRSSTVDAGLAYKF